MTFDSKLVIVEGIPGSGKTTTARGVDAWLRRAGARPRLFLEGDLDHPADFESAACLSEEEFARLEGSYPGARAGLETLAERRRGQVFVSFRKLPSPPAGLAEALGQRDVYNLPRDEFLRVTRERWEDFALQAARGEAVHVFECCLLQNQLTMLMAVHDLDEEAIAAQVLGIAERLRPLRPLAIYLEPPGVRETLEKIAAERPRSWLEFAIGYTTGGAWGKARGVNGLEGMLRFYEERVALEKKLLARLGWRSLRVEEARDGQGGVDWAAVRARVERFLEEAKNGE